ncbi:MAG: ornithine cyclodeaminase family protein, partial [Nitriliruptorales bacterium]|nr:ornithine cyclodeaminase family protein [Nitriliruptorales bacterium]
YSPTPANREAYAAEMAERYGIEAVAVDDPREVYRDVDILCGCTDAAGEVIRGDWLEAGTHITCVGGRPDRATYERVDTWLRLGTVPAPRGHEDWRTTDENLVYAARPDAEVWSRHASDQRTRRPPTAQDRARLVYLEEVLNDGAVVRSGPEDVTYSERGNIQGAQFHAVACVIYEAAVDKSLGRELPTEWFLQDIRD